MAIKTLTLPLPRHLKKYLEYEFETRDGKIHIEKSSWLGHMIQLSSQHIPYTQKPYEVKGESVKIQYYVREKVRDVPNDKIPQVVAQIDETFRLALRNYVCSVRRNLQCDYSPYIEQFLSMIDYEPDEEKEWEAIRKMYRDYEAKISKKNEKRFV